MTEDVRPVILWDGQCGFCRQWITWVKRQDHARQLRAVPFQDMPAPPMTPELYRQCQQALHVRFHDGRLLRAGQACLYILETLGCGRTVRLLQRWPLRWGVEAGYWLVARSRPLLARLFSSHQ